MLSYHARYYNPAIARFISADNLIAQPGNPQTWNRYSYVTNNPLRYTDPSGHCAAEDSECWRKRDEVATHIGYAPSGTEGWSTDQLQHLLDWIFRGIRFTSNDGPPGSNGGTWVDTNISDVLTGLDKVQSFLGDKTDTYLGLGGDNTLTFNKFAGTGIGGLAHPDSGIVDLYFTDDSSPKAMWTVIHELGHVVDWHLGSGSYWSETSSEWRAGSGWSRNPATDTWKLGDAGAKGLSSGYADRPREDFAETFLLMVNPGESSFAPAASNPSRSLDPSRANAINTALGR